MIWQPAHFTLRQATLDFTSSGQGLRHVTQLFADGQRVANAVELTDWTGDPVQVEVCESCGNIHCAPGGWVSLRRLGRQVLLIPAFTSILEDPAEYQSPSYFAQRGVVLVSDTHYADLRSLASGLAPFDALAPLTCREAAMTLQCQAPGGVLGTSPMPPALSPAAVLASEPGGPGEQAMALNGLLATCMASGSPAIARPIYAPVRFFLDLPGTPEWMPFTQGEFPALILGPDLGASAQ